MNDFFEPRDVYEMTEFFEDLVFMRAKKFLEDDAEDGDEKISLSSAGLNLLGSVGITGRIFRRWYQTTWGWESPSKWFEGETPRMELVKRYPGLTKGDAYIGVQLLHNASSNTKVVPALYEAKEIEKASGIISMGYNFLPKSLDARKRFHHLPAPNFDPEFKEFINLMEEIEEDIKREEIERLPVDFEARCWQIFWSDAFITIPLNCELKLSHEKLITAGSMMRLAFELAAKEQRHIPDSYINFDHLFNVIWEIFRSLDSNLLFLDEILPEKKSPISDLVNKRNGLYSLNVYYNLGNLIDELLLFPADRYFGACECVWTDKMNFISDLVMGISLLNNNLKFPETDENLSESQKKFKKFTSVDKSIDIYRVWFCPPTCFRILPKFINYF